MEKYITKDFIIIMSMFGSYFAVFNHNKKIALWLGGITEILLLSISLKLIGGAVSAGELTAAALPGLEFTYRCVLYSLAVSVFAPAGLFINYVFEKVKKYK